MKQIEEKLTRNNVGKRWGSLLAVLAMAALLLAACAQQGGFASESMSQAADEALYYEMETAERSNAAPIMASDGNMEFAIEETAVEAPAALQSDVTRLIIRTADMRIVVLDTEEALARIAEMAESSGGWVVDSNVFQSTETAKTGYMTIRVPAAGFQSALDAISGLSAEVTELRTSGQDVTEEYVDLEARLGNLETTAERVRGFMDETRNVEEALDVSRELSRLEGEIEQIKGRMQYLDQSAAFSTIAVSVTPDELVQPVSTSGWRPAVVVQDAIDALLQGLQSLANIAIWLVITVLPIALLVGLPIALLVYLVRRRRNRAASLDDAIASTDA